MPGSSPAQIPRRLRGRPAGITLVELLLVLVLLVIVGSLAAPAVTNSFSSVRLRRAGDALLTRWAHARARAVETGTPMEFLFQPEAGQYRVQAWTGAEADAVGAASASSGSTPASASAAPIADGSADAASSSSSGDPSEAAVSDYTLPEGVTFQGGEAQLADPATQERRVAALEATRGSWSTPILFFPDGTASHAAVVLTNDHQQYLRLTIRGLTGVARASAVLSREELQRGTRTR